MPPGACDTHMHIYDRRYPEAPSAVKSTPPDFTVANYKALQNKLGLERVVLIQPTTYGLDNSCQIDAAKEFGNNARLIVVIDEQTPISEIERMNAIGVRGVRFFMWDGGALGWDSLEPIAEKIAPFGWHIQLHINGNHLPNHQDRLKRLPCPVCIDHIGRFSPIVEPDHICFQSLLSLLDTGNFWVKISAPYLHSKSGPPLYEDIGELVFTLIENYSDRLLWGTNAPHPGFKNHPCDIDLTNLIPRWITSTANQRKILVENPEILFGFSSIANDARILKY